MSAHPFWWFFPLFNSFILFQTFTDSLMSYPASEEKLILSNQLQFLVFYQKDYQYQTFLTFLQHQHPVVLEVLDIAPPVKISAAAVPMFNIKSSTCSFNRMFSYSMSNFMTHYHSKTMFIFCNF